MSDLESFRKETRAWLEENCPALMRTPAKEEDSVWGGKKFEFPSEDARIWLDRMGEKGWTAPMWPAKYGGGGLSRDENKILQEELARINARPALLSFGIWMFGPVLMEYGTEEQKMRFLPDIVKGKTRWCQGYSEPGAGSDLAGLQTKCEDKGDHWLINGQKVWTSYADQADWIFCLVRTDNTVKHAGISFVVFDMTSPGVETRPILLISGSSPFCETFFTDVKIPKEQMVGELNKGWEIAKRLLQYERTNISAGGFGRNAVPTPLYEQAKQYIGEENGQLADPDMRSRLAHFQMADEAFGLTVDRMTQQAKSGEEVGHTASIIKYAAATLNKHRTELAVEAMGSQGIGWEGEAYSREEILTPRSMLRAKANSIEGGTTEINLNVISKRVLGLPDPT